MRGDFGLVTGLFVGHVPGIPGAHSQGATKLSAEALVKRNRPKLSKWNVVDYLQSETDIAGYLAACRETEYSI